MRKLFVVFAAFLGLGVITLLLFVLNGLWLAHGEQVDIQVIGQPKPQLQTGDTLRVVAYNIAKAGAYKGGLGFASTQQIRQKLQQLADTLRPLNPDLIFLSEALRDCGPCPVNQIETLAKLLEMPVWAFGENYNVGLPFFRVAGGNAILSKWPLKPVKNISLIGRQPFYVTKNNRRVLFCELAVNDQPILLGALHNDSLNLKNNLAQSQQILKFLGDNGTLLAGDFNARPGSASIRLFQQSKKFAGMFDGTPSFPAHKPIRQIDYVLGPAHWVLLESKAIASQASDHRPVLAVFRVNSS
ncbi:MAG: endonuclease/exonuclease/phosphatase family protein [Pseudomonadota bacterium]